MEIRAATRADLPAIVQLLANDPLGAAREHIGDPLPDAYGTAFEAMARQGGNELLVAVADGTVGGGRIGETLIRYAIERARGGTAPSYSSRPTSRAPTRTGSTNGWASWRVTRV